RSSQPLRAATAARREVEVWTLWPLRAWLLACRSRRGRYSHVRAPAIETDEEHLCPCAPVNSSARSSYFCSLRYGFYLQSEEHTFELQSLTNLVCRLLLEKKKNNMLKQ